MKVIATAPGYDGTYREVGDVFEMDDKAIPGKDGTWWEPVDKKTAKKTNANVNKDARGSGPKATDTDSEEVEETEAEEAEVEALKATANSKPVVTKPADKPTNTNSLV